MPEFGRAPDISTPPRYLEALVISAIKLLNVRGGRPARPRARGIIGRPCEDGDAPRESEPSFTREVNSCPRFRECV